MVGLHYVKEHVIVLENGVRSCMHFCFQPPVPFDRCVCSNICDFALTKSVQNINGIMLFGNYLVREKGKRLFCTFMTKRLYILLNQYMDLLT